MPVAVLWCVFCGGAAWSRPVVRVFAVYCNAYPGKAGAINKSIDSDRLLVSNLFQENVSEAGWGVTLKITEVMGAEATKTGILRRYAEVAASLGAEDTLYVHFSGHGGIPDQATGVQMLDTCDMKQINRTEWAEAIGRLPCRLKILITDCCSSYNAVEVAEGDEEVQPWKSLHGLLMKHRGFVNITAASPGQSAYCTNVGGYLTVNLHSDMQRYASWDQVFAETQKRVQEETRGQQKPLAYQLGEKINSPAAADRGPDYILPDSATRLLTRAELQSMGLQQLYLARNEIAARHGQDFSTPLLQRYFGSKDWYRRQSGKADSDLSAVESNNALLILQVEKEQGGPFITKVDPAQSASGNGAIPDIFPYSSARYLNRTIVESLSRPQHSIARNEIFARHGYPFKSAALQKHFARKPYYRRNPLAEDPAFNDVERQNLWLIEKIERIRGGAHKWE